MTIPDLVTESRWPPILAILLAVALVTSLPSRYSLAPSWFPWTAFAAVVAPMVVLTLMPASVLWHRIERAIVLAFCLVVWVMVVLGLIHLVADMVNHKHDYSSITLLESGAVIWTINILVFALSYWQMDRAGPEGRASGDAGPADFAFAEVKEAEGDERWRPQFLDYLFLAFATATSFTPPDYAKPATRRAKLLVMCEALISLLTLFLIASRAVATLA